MAPKGRQLRKTAGNVLSGEASAAVPGSSQDVRAGGKKPKKRPASAMEIIDRSESARKRTARMFNPMDEGWAHWRILSGDMMDPADADLAGRIAVAPIRAEDIIRYGLYLQCQGIRHLNDPSGSWLNMVGAGMAKTILHYLTEKEKTEQGRSALEGVLIRIREDVEHGIVSIMDYPEEERPSSPQEGLRREDGEEEE